MSSLATAWGNMERLQGKDPARWQWGRLQHTLFEDPPAPLRDAAERARVNVGPLPRGGGGFTVNVSSYHRDTFRQAHGASFRMVIDVVNWDNARAINTPGQSGDPANPHYRDLAASWAAGQYFRLLYSCAAAEKAAAQVIELAPGADLVRPRYLRSRSASVNFLSWLPIDWLL